MAGARRISGLIGSARRFPRFAKCLALLVVLGISLSGCATPYQAKGFEGGYTEAWASEETVWISFSGNVTLDPETLEQSLLRRAADVTLRSGFTSFVVLRREHQVGAGLVVNPGIFSRSILGPTRHTQRAILIQCFAGHPGRPDAIDATQLLFPTTPAPGDASSL